MRVLMLSSILSIISRSIFCLPHVHGFGWSYIYLILFFVLLLAWHEQQSEWSWYWIRIWCVMRIKERAFRARRYYVLAEYTLLCNYTWVIYARMSIPCQREFPNMIFFARIMKNLRWNISIFNFLFYYSVVFVFWLTTSALALTFNHPIQAHGLLVTYLIIFKIRKTHEMMRKKFPPNANVPQQINGDEVKWTE